MKTRIRFNEIDGTFESHETPISSRALIPHTYTPQSHENLLRGYSIMKVRESSFTNYIRENKKLKAELKRLNEEVRRNREEIQMLKSQLTRDTTNNTNTEMNGTEAAEEGPRDMLSQHFSEMMKRYHKNLSEKDRQINALQKKLKQYENNHQQNPAEKQICTHEFYYECPRVEADQTSHTNSHRQVFRTDMAVVKTQTGHLPLDDSRSRDRAVVWHPRVEAERPKPKKATIPRIDFDLLHTRPKHSSQENGTAPCSKSRDRAVVANPIVKTKRPKPKKVAIPPRDLDLVKTQPEDSLLDGERLPYSSSKERAGLVHPSVDAERLRRTNAAIQVFRRDLELVKTQLENSPLDDERFPCSSSRDRLVVEELRRRQHFGVIADLEAMGNKFFQRLEFEERLDKLHWELESKRYLEHKCLSGGECASTCTYQQEFQMLEITRNNLLEALGDLRAGLTHHAPQPQPQPPSAETNFSINTIQTLYMNSPSVNFAQSCGSVRDTTSESPDK